MRSGAGDFVPNPMKPTLAVDFGGRRIKLGLAQDGVILARHVLPARAEEPLAARLNAVAASLRQLCGEAAVAPRECAGIGLAYPSLIDVANVRILDHFGKFGDASTVDLRAWARAELGLPLAIDNDARMALVGEWRHGAGRGCGNVVMITFGTGIGTAVIQEGRVLRGAHGQAGILGGHLTVRHGGRACVCGNVGCAEAEASTWALAQFVRERPDFAVSALAGEALIDFASVFRLAAAGDACARGLRDHALEVWSALAVSLIHAYDPERLILGGGVMASGDIVLPAIREHVERHAHTPWGKVNVVASELGDGAALLGCEWLVREQILKDQTT